MSHYSSHIAWNWETLSLWKFCLREVLSLLAQCVWRQHEPSERRYQTGPSSSSVAPVCLEPRAGSHRATQWPPRPRVACVTQGRAQDRVPSSSAVCLADGPCRGISDGQSEVARHKPSRTLHLI